MKICKKHNEEHVKKGSRTGCRSCNREYQAKWNAQNKALAQERNRNSQRNKRKREMELYLSLFDGKACVDCGEDRIPCLDFDHDDPTQKSFGVSQGFRLRKSWEEVQIEAEKCTIRCANCHRIKTANEFGWYGGQ